MFEFLNQSVWFVMALKFVIAKWLCMVIKYVLIYSIKRRYFLTYSVYWKDYLKLNGLAIKDKSKVKVSNIITVLHWLMPQ